MILHFKCFQFSRSVMSNSLRAQGLQHTRLPCPSPTPGACSDSRPLSLWCHSTISSSCHPLLLLPLVFPSIRVFSMKKEWDAWEKSISLLTLNAKLWRIWSRNGHPVWQPIRAPSDLLSKGLWRASYSRYPCSIQKSQQGAPLWALLLHSLVTKCIRATSSRWVIWKQLKLEKGSKLARLGNITGEVWWGENVWEDRPHTQNQNDAMSFFPRKLPNEDSPYGQEMMHISTN